ncbi:MAG: hypothetical protein A370_04078 [Clostridium sp. Maddingley MBC34-26]|uniref:hypothetical protein n=1 Tax=Clostridium sp. LS TaxID=1352601 RepID=UPI000297F568|nr:hypothetical protein [Clostridium sp. LS]EKQ52658.1 MAG: hypothetical protein A370_04078 [Clostridium sp. Maddingley MBC34-26]
MNSLAQLRLRQKIFLRKALLNFLLKRLCPTNKIVVIVSQNLDKYVSLQQYNIYIKQCNIKVTKDIHPCDHDHLSNKVLLTFYSCYINRI